MLNCFKIAWKYIFRYPKRSLVLFLSISLSVFLIVGIGSLAESTRNADLKNVKNYDGQQHVIYRELDVSAMKNIKNNNRVNRYAGMFYYDMWQSENQFLVNLLAADEEILYMEDTGMAKGRFPTQVNEIALESWVLERLRLPAKPGQILEIYLPDREETQSFELVGIIKDRISEKSGGQMQAFIAFDESYLPGRENHINMLVEFKTGLKIQDEINKIAAEIGCEKANVLPNRALLDSMGQLHALDWNLIKISLILMLVAGMVIYSIYGITVLRRIKDYGIMRATGASSRQVVYMLIAEILIICAAGTVCGIILGSSFVHIFKGVSTDLFAITETIGQPRLDTIVISAFAIKLAVVVALGSTLAAAIRAAMMVMRLTPVEAITSCTMDAGVSARESVLEKLLSIPQKISFKNLNRNKMAVWFTVITMSIGCSLLLMQSFKLELFDRERDYLDGVYATKDYEFRVNINNGVPLSMGYTEEQTDNIKNWPQVDDVSSQHILYSRMKIKKNRLNGINGENYVKVQEEKLAEMVQEADDIVENPEDRMNFAFYEDDDILIRNTIEGLADEQLAPLHDMLDAGGFDINKMKQEPLAVLYIPHVNEKGSPYRFSEDGEQKELKPILNIKAGDKLTVSYPRDAYLQADNWELMYQYEKYRDRYSDQEFTVAGIIKERYLPEKDGFQLGTSSNPYILISENMFKDLFGINNYRIVSIDISDDTGCADYQVLREKVISLAELFPGTAMMDRREDLEYARKARAGYMLLYTSIAAILMIIGGLSIYNNINYNLISRLREHGIMKAIGLTGRQFKKMLLFEGLAYGGISGFFSCTIGLLLQTGFFIYHSYLAPYTLVYRQFFIEWELYLIVILINLFIGYIATIGPARQVNKMEITEAIRAVE